MDEPLPPIVLLAYDGVAADEARALVEILTAADLPVVIASVASSTVTSFHGRVIPTRTVDDLAGCSAVIVPGGMGVQSAATSQSLLDAIGLLAADATWLGSTSTGSVLLAAAGVVDGARATTHWLAGEMITDRGLRLVDESFVEHGRLLTASGIASTATLAFRLIGALAGVHTENEIRAAYSPRPSDSDARYERVREPFWRRWLGRRRVGEVSSIGAIDPDGRTEVILLDLDDAGGRP